MNILTKKNNSSNSSKITNKELKENINSNNNDFLTLNNNKLLNSDYIEIEKKRLFFSNKNNTSEKNIFNNRNKPGYVQINAKKRRTDITDPFYFKEIGEEITKLNNDTMNYNITEAENKNKTKNIYSRNNRIEEEISISPEKDRNFLMYEMKDLNHYVLFVKDLDMKEYIIKEIIILNDLLRDKKVSKEFREYIKKTIAYFKK